MLATVGVLAGCGDEGGCPTGQTMCGGKCVTTSSDPGNCGKCGTACGSGQSCVAGVCGCAGTTTECNGACVNTASDPANCGACGTACKTGEICDTGACKPSGSCAAPRQICDGACVDLQSSIDNCGACGTKCDATKGQSCVSGKCGCAKTGETLCNGACVAMATDPNNCGTCGTKCTTGQVCTNGKCEGSGSCVAPKQICSGACIDPQSDNNNCGTCGTKCDTAAGLTCVAGVCSCIAGMSKCGTPAKCVNLQTDPANCGVCGTACGAGVGCVAGVCSTCPTGQTLCGTAGCQNLQTSNTNCGTCGTACTGGKVCASGVCGCPTGTTDCGGTCFDLQTSAAHCGTCPNACAAGVPCVAGVCKPCPTGQTQCGSPPACVTTATDNNNCGTCGTVCTGGKTCQNSACGCPTTLPNECSGTCYNFQNDEQHCGSCSKVCAATETCSAGSCTTSPVTSINITCNGLTNVPKGMQVQCTATATLASGATGVDVTNDPHVTWVQGTPACGQLNYNGTKGLYLADGAVDCTTTVVANYTLGTSTIPSNQLTLKTVLAKVLSIVITPTAPKVPKLTGLVVNFDVKCVFDNGLTDICPIGADVAWSSSNTNLPIVAATGAFPRAGGFATTDPAGVATIQASLTANAGCVAPCWVGTLPTTSATTVVTVVGDTYNGLTVSPSTKTIADGQTFGFKVIASFNASDTFDITELCTSADYTCGAFTGPTFTLPGTSATYVTNPTGHLNTTSHEWEVTGLTATPAGLPATVRAQWIYGTVTKTADLAVTVSGAAFTGCFVTLQNTPPGAGVLPTTCTIANGCLGTFAKGQTGVQLYVWGYYSDSTIAPLDITSSVAWSSASPNIATVSGAAGSEGKVNMIAAGNADIIANPSGLQAGLANCKAVVTVVNGKLCTTAGALTVVPTYAGKMQRRQYIPGTGVLTDSPMLPNEAGWTQKFRAIAKYDTDTTATGCDNLAHATVFDVDVTDAAAWTATPATGQPAALIAGTAKGEYTTSPSSATGMNFRSITIQAVMTDPPGSTNIATGQLAAHVCGIRQAGSFFFANAFNEVGSVETAGTINLNAGASTGSPTTPADPTLRMIFVDAAAPAGACQTGYKLQITEDATGFTTSDSGIATVSSTTNTKGRVKGVAPGDATIFGNLGVLASTSLAVHVTSATITACNITPLSKTAYVLPGMPAKVQFKATGTLSNGTTGADVTDKVTWAIAGSGGGCSIFDATNYPGLIQATTAGQTCKVQASVGGVNCTPVPSADPYVTVLAATLTGMFVQTSDKTCYDAAPTTSAGAPYVMTATTKQNLFGCLTYNNGGRVAIDVVTEEPLLGWGTSNTTYATVNSMGLVSATATPGAATITATYSGTTPATVVNFFMSVTATTFQAVSGLAFQSANIGAAGCSLLNVGGGTPVTMEACEKAGTHVMYRVIGTRTDGSKQDVTDTVAFTKTAGASTLTELDSANMKGYLQFGGAGYLTLKAAMTIISTVFEVSNDIGITTNDPNTLTLTAVPSATITGQGNHARLKTMANVPVTGGNLTLDLSNNATYGFALAKDGGKPNIVFIEGGPSILNGWMTSTETPGTTVVTSAMTGATTATLTVTTN